MTEHTQIIVRHARSERIKRFRVYVQHYQRGNTIRKDSPGIKVFYFFFINHGAPPRKTLLVISVTVNDIKTDNSKSIGFVWTAVIIIRQSKFVHLIVFKNPIMSNEYKKIKTRYVSIL